MVEVFKTNVDNIETAEKIKEIIIEKFPFCNVNFDLQDCDRILRVDKSVSATSVIEIVRNQNYICEILE